MVCPAETLEFELKIALRLGEAEGPRAADRSGELLGVGGDRNRAVVGRAPDTLRAAKSTPLSVRSTVPLLTKDFAVTELDPKIQLPVLVSAPPIVRLDRRRSGRDGYAVLASAPVVDTAAPYER